MKKITFLLIVFLSSSAMYSQESEEIIEEVAIEEVVDKPQDIPFSIIEEVPIYPGCENLGRTDKKTCFQNKIVKHISKNFNYVNKDSLASGRKKIYVMFTIDKEGIVKNINARAPHPALASEGKRVIQLIPQMTPGKQRGKPVNVKYLLPITFTIE